MVWNQCQLGKLEDVNEVIVTTVEDVKDFAVEKMEDFKRAVIETKSQPAFGDWQERGAGKFQAEGDKDGRDGGGGEAKAEA